MLPTEKRLNCTGATCFYTFKGLGKRGLLNFIQVNVLVPSNYPVPTSELSSQLAKISDLESLD